MHKNMAQYTSKLELDPLQTEQPLISIIIPAFNAKNTLEQCVHSALSQTYTNLEIVLVNDGSNDGSQELIDLFSETDSRIKALHLTNCGVSAARNRGINESSGDFIFFLDADDTIHTETIELLYSGHLQSDASLVICGFERFNPEPMNSPDSLVFANDRHMNNEDIYLYTLKYLSAPNRHPLFVTTWGKLIRANAIRENAVNFEESMRSMEDVHFNFRLLAHIDSAYYVARKLYNYRVYSSASSATTQSLTQSDSLFGFANALEEVRQYLSTQINDTLLINKSISHAYVVYTIIHLIRLCLQWNFRNHFQIVRRVSSLILAPRLSDCLEHYAPKGQDSRVIPYLMRRKIVIVTMLFCKYKAWCRYRLRR